MFRAAAIVAFVCSASVVVAQEAPVRDPMRPFGSAAAAVGVAAAPSGPRFALTGVLIGASRRVALVNGKPQIEGDVVDGAEIVAIEPGAVRLRDNGSELVISLAKSASARPPLVQGVTVP